MKSLCWKEGARARTNWKKKKKKKKAEREKWKRLHSVVVNSSSSLCLFQTHPHLFCFIVQQNILKFIHFCASFYPFFHSMYCSLRLPCTFTRKVNTSNNPNVCLSIHLYLSEHNFFPIVYHMHFTGYFIDMWSVDSCISTFCYVMWIALPCSMVVLYGCCKWVSKCWFFV